MRMSTNTLHMAFGRKLGSLTTLTIGGLLWHSVRLA